ncbi:MAG: carbohydrate ABC transporter permease [Christensenellaceae bacterium]|jgi:ABC transporter, permease protein
MVNSENTGARLKKWFGRNFGNNAGDRTFHVLNTLIFLAVGFIALYPFLYVFVKSLQAYDVSEGVQRITYSFSAYKNIFADDGLIKTFLLSVAVVLAGTLCNVAVTYACAYALSKKYLKGRTLLLIFVLIPMLFSGGLMPTYILIRQLNLKNNPLVYILPSLCSSFNVIIVKNFLHSVPESMEEAAMLDGASHFKIMTKIYLPLSAPILATIALWVAVGKWNDWMTGLLYVDEKSLYIMQNYLRTVLISSYSAETNNPDILNKGESIVMASIVVGTLPVIASFPFVQKYFIKGMILGSVKE